MTERDVVPMQRVVTLATAEARRLHHARIGTEHLLLGLLADEDTPTAGVLRDAGASLAAARHKVAEAAGSGSAPPDDATLPLSPRAQRALDRAGRFSRQQRQAEVTATHVLLGVLDVEGLACQVLRGLGVDVNVLRDALVDDPAEPASNPRADDVDGWTPTCPSCRAALDGGLRSSVIPARDGDGGSVDVRVISCGRCGTAVGVLLP